MPLSEEQKEELEKTPHEEVVEDLLISILAELERLNEQLQYLRNR